MVIVRLIGGLGNQMFQYACGRRLSIVLHTPLALDLEWLNTSRNLPHEVYGLAPFTLCPDLTLLPRGPSRKSRRSAQVLTERSFAVDRRVLTATGHIYLDGYWQNEAYFADVADQIRKELAPLHPLAAAPMSLAELVADEGSVSLHVRRTAYPNSLPPAYYQDAVAEMRRHFDDPRFCVFSDELDWARRELRLPSESVFVDVLDPSQPWLDLVAMSHCRHHIIANSTFSWWGAWLDPRPEKIVLAPRFWFLTNRHHQDDFSLPSAWRRV